MTPRFTVVSTTGEHVSGRAPLREDETVDDAPRNGEAVQRRDAITPASVTADFNASQADARHVERNTVAFLNEAAKLARDTARMPRCDPRHSTLYHRAAAALEAILEQM